MREAEAEGDVGVPLAEDVGNTPAVAADADIVLRSFGNEWRGVGWRRLGDAVGNDHRTQPQKDDRRQQGGAPFQNAHNPSPALFAAPRQLEGNLTY